MLKILYSNSFLKSAKKAPPTIQRRLGENLEVLQENPFHSLLHTKSLSGQLSGFYSFRVTRDWRVIFCFLDTQTIKLVEMAHRKDIYK